MGTNFHVRGYRDNDEPGPHIGKRSAAGAYCWKCKITLCQEGHEGIHYGTSSWYKACPKCKAKPIEEGISTSSVGRELGFNRNKPKSKKGVSSCSSFSWAIDPKDLKSVIKDKFLGHCRSCGEKYKKNDKVIEDEYGALYSLEEFKQVLKECPIQFTHSIGMEFC